MFFSKDVLINEIWIYPYNSPLPYPQGLFLVPPFPTSLPGILEMLVTTLLAIKFSILRDSPFERWFLWVCFLFWQLTPRWIKEITKMEFEVSIYKKER